MNELITLAVLAALAVASMRLRPHSTRIDDPVSLPGASPTDARAGSPGTSHPDRGRRDAWAAAWHRRRALAHPPSARAVAEWCDDLARHVRSGSTLRDALMSSSTSDPAVEHALRPLRLAIDRGSSVADALHRIGAPGAHLQLAVSVVGTAARLGGPSSAAIDRTAMALRRRAAELDDRATQAAQARLSTHVMTALPLLMLGVLVATDDDVRAVVVSPLGAGCIAAGLTLNLAGWWWMRRIVGAPR